MRAAVERSEIVIALGGDNSITVAAALGAFGEHLPTAGLITLDAHYDLRDGISNGSPVRRLIEAGLDPQRIVQIGIQDFANSADYATRARDYGITVIHRDECERRPMDDIMLEALEIAGSAGGPIHVDIDVDVCDRAVAPACPASVPGGLSAFELRRAARVAASDLRVASLDIAEVDASADTPDGRTVRLSALCVLEALAGVASR
jgi:formiminoglutamase